MFTVLSQLLESVLFKKFCSAVVILAVGVLAIRIFMRLLRATLEKSHMEKAAYSLITSLAKAAMYVILFLIAASALGIDVSSIVALASVLTLALSLALQNMVSNVIGGFTILYTHPFRSGDYVEIAGQGGVVQTIDITYTKLTTPDNKTISIPNSAVVASQIVNYSTSGTRRVDISVSASYDTPIETVKAALLAAAKLDAVLDTPAAPFAAVMSYGESAINYCLRVWTSADEYWNVFFTINENIKTEFDKAGVQMTYPHLNVHIDK